MFCSVGDKKTAKLCKVKYFSCVTATAHTHRGEIFHWNPRMKGWKKLSFFAKGFVFSVPSGPLVVKWSHGAPINGRKSIGNWA